MNTDTSNPGESQFMKMPGSSTNMSSLFENKNLFIIILIGLLLLSILGINILAISGNILQTITNIFGPMISQILSIFGYTTGTILNKSADIVGDTAKTGIDIAEGTVHSVGDLLKNASDANVNADAKRGLDDAINRANRDREHRYEEPKPDHSDNPIQNPITSSKNQWCLVGEYQSKRGCIEIGESDKCISGQLFPTQQMCLNPTMSQNK